MSRLWKPFALALAVMSAGAACNSPQGTSAGAKTPDASQSVDATSSDSASEAATTGLADVVQVSASGSPGQYTFSVTVASPDTGCDKYADHWEVLSEQGDLLYRRILAHSHVSEQPFSRTGGPVPAQATDTVIVRAHMRPGGYGGTAFRGNIDKGLSAAPPAPNFAQNVETRNPAPARFDESRAGLPSPAQLAQA